MALKIVTGGTTGAADGTAVSQGGAFTNPLVIVALNTAVDAHIRCDDGYWSADQHFDVPAELEVSFDGGSTWYDNADEPITAPEIYAVNVPIKIRQTTAASSTSGSFTTDGTYTAIAALSTPTLTATVVSPTRIDLSWTNVANEDASPGYTIERSLDGSSWSALTTKAQNVTTHSDTGLTPGQHYYYRVKAEGSGRYSDSGWGTDDDTPNYTVLSVNAGSGGFVRNYSASSSWATLRAAATGTAVNTTATDGMPFWYNNGASGDRYCDRGGYAFDLSSLPGGATIVSARLRLSVTNIYATSGSTVIVSSTHANPLTTADYDNLMGTTEYATRVAGTALTSGGAYNDFTFVSAGLSAILAAAGGTFKCAIRSSYDVDNSVAPDGATGFSGHSHADASLKPILEVTYY